MSNLEMFIAEVESDLERRNRIRLSLAAYAYEYKNTSIMTDAEFDSLSKKINKDVPTGNETMDKFFREQFEPDTGMWIHKHPDLAGLEKLYGILHENKKRWS